MFKSIEVSYFLGVTGFLVTAVILLVCKSLYDIRHLLQFGKKYKGYTFYPVIGNGIHVLGKNVFNVIEDVIKKFGSPCSIWLAHDYNYVTTDPKDMKIILTHPNSIDKHSVYNHIAMFFLKTLLIAPADDWKKNRKLYSKSFNQPILNSFVQFFYAKCCPLVDKVLRDLHPDEVFDVFGKYTFDVFCASLIGADYDLQINPEVPLVKLILDTQEICGKRLVSGYYLPEIIWKNFTPSGRQVVKNYAEARKFVYAIIEDKRKTFKENSVTESAQEDKALPLLDFLLQMGIDDDMIFKEMFLFAVAATDTTGYTLTYTFTLLGMNPDIQEKVFQEVISTVGYDREIYHDDLSKLKYTERAILESLRILPVVPLVGRHATSDIDLGHTVVPKGTNVALGIFQLHRDPKIWPDPLKFDPDRFLPEEVAKRDPFSYIPFSGGARNCIGKTYSMMLMKTCVAHVIRNYEVVSKNKSVLEFNLESCVTMRAISGLHCRFIPRKHQ